MHSSATIMVMISAGVAAGGITATEIPSEARIMARTIRTLEITGDDPMHLPTDVAVDASGRVYVVDGANNRLVRFAKDGSSSSIIDQPGGQSLRRPVGVFVDRDNVLWIADSGNHRVLIYQPDDDAVRTVELPEGTDGKPADPVDIAVTPDGKRAYIVDNDNHRLLIRDGEGTITQMGGRGTGLGLLEYPFTIALGPDGYAHICEAIGARVQRLSPQDRWAGQVGRWGVQLGQIYRPKGVAVDTHSRIYVSDSTLNVVQLFGVRGNVLGVLSDETGKPVRLRHPMGMWVDATGLLYIVEMRANRVAVFEVSGAAPAGKNGEKER